MKIRAKERLYKVADWVGTVIGWTFDLMFLAVFMIIYSMSKKHKRRKHKQHKQNKSKNSGNNTTTTTTKTVRREPVAVMESVKHTNNPTETRRAAGPTQTIENTLPGKSYRVFRKPAKWATDSCRFVGMVARCKGTDRIHGAKLFFPTGETIHIPFEDIEEVFPNSGRPAPVAISSASGKINYAGKKVTKENIRRQGHYRVVRKPDYWKVGCKYLSKVGVCILVDERDGQTKARLRFADNNDISFPLDCLEEVEAIDLNKTATTTTTNEITEDNVKIGEIFRVIKTPSNFGSDAERLVGMVGKSKWANYRGVCLKFADGSGYCIEFDALERVKPICLPNPTKVPEKLNGSNIVIGRKYKISKLPADFDGDITILGKMAKVEWASDASKGAMMVFENSYQKVIPFDCIEDLPRPDNDELIYMIKKNPEKILRIIKGLNKITRLKPVRDFVEKGLLPEVTSTETKPDCVSAICSGQTVGEACDEMMNRVVALIGPSQTTTPTNNTENGNPS